MPALPTSGVDIDTSEENGVSSLLDKDWNWKWDYDELYEANGFNVDGQRATSGLSTESPFYFMEFYNQDRSNDGAQCVVLAFTISMALYTFFSVFELLFNQLFSVVKIFGEIYQFYSEGGKINPF